MLRKIGENPNRTNNVRYTSSQGAIGPVVQSKVLNDAIFYVLIHSSGQHVHTGPLLQEWVKIKVHTIASCPGAKDLDHDFRSSARRWQMTPRALGMHEARVPATWRGGCRGRHAPSSAVRIDAAVAHALLPASAREYEGRVRPVARATIFLATFLGARRALSRGATGIGRQTGGLLRPSRHRGSPPKERKFASGGFPGGALKERIKAGNFRSLPLLGPYRC
jgi:hypothetical protein